MRGSPTPSIRRINAGGIIPAHAGLTILDGVCVERERDHPRACGAHNRIFTSSGHRMGSSPRMRGSLLGPSSARISLGIIPAHAGLTQASLHPVLYAGDHPRACGAHSLNCTTLTTCRGSSPRMRGSLLVHLALETNSGIIPAHAGLTLGYRRVLCRCEDHPRACGAHWNW